MLAERLFNLKSHIISLTLVLYTNSICKKHQCVRKSGMNLFCKEPIFIVFSGFGTGVCVSLTMEGLQ